MHATRIAAFCAACRWRAGSARRTTRPKRSRRGTCRSTPRRRSICGTLRARGAAESRHRPTLAVATKGIERGTLVADDDGDRRENSPDAPSSASRGRASRSKSSRASRRQSSRRRTSPTRRGRRAEALSSGSFRVYTHDDVIGVELGGALKNVMAVATGIVEGVGVGLQLARGDHHARPARDDSARRRARCARVHLCRTRRARRSRTHVHRRAESQSRHRHRAGAGCVARGGARRKGDRCRGRRRPRRAHSSSPRSTTSTCRSCKWCIAFCSRATRRRMPCPSSWRVNFDRSKTYDPSANRDERIRSRNSSRSAKCAT